MALARVMVHNGDLNELPDERFWLEIKKALSDKAPEHFFGLLYEVGALEKVSFFKRLLGSDQVPETLRVLRNVAGGVSHIEEPLKSDVFAALVACENVQGSLTSARSVNLYRALQNLKNTLSVWHTKEQVFDVLSKAKAWSMSCAADDLVLSVSVAQARGLAHSSISAGALRWALEAGRSVTSDAYQHLVGPEIGKAMAAERVRRIGLALNVS
jgi:tRNA nucleotidyltransferase/poly(A) polymerase